ESDELEKAAASSPNQPPREVRHVGDRNGQSEVQKPDQRQDRGGGPRRPAAESAPGGGEAELAGTGSAASGSLVISEPTGSGQESPDEHGGKRWRGRRRRRGGRGGPGEAPVSRAGAEEPADAEIETATEPVTHAIRAAAAPAPRAERASTTFVLPGE